ncbi:hypothetical protein Q2T40_14735 [Winogradskyella maritima]|uniref:Uncharacterized protein n=1 Tax=Winogradskyella maritima TaxID=1517766 RepID=A0ABV8AK73_9FLAO|nr:hypothetical protein [Winogradskyella maritima]
MSFTIEKHFCGGTLVDTAVFTKAKSCTSEMETPVKKPCCKNEVELIKSVDDLTTVTLEDVSLEHIQLFQVVLYGLQIQFESLPKQLIPHKDYAPPNLIADIQLLDEVFLI